MNARKTRRVSGHVDRLDAERVEGWAFGPAGLPRIALRISRQVVEAAVERYERPDIAAIFGPSAREAGFRIDLRGIAPAASDQLQKFFKQVEIRADGVAIKPSAKAQLPWAKRPGLTGGLPGLRRNKLSPSEDAEQKKYFREPARRARLHGKDLTLVVDKTSRVREGDLLAFVTCRNEKVRIPYFLEFYRRIGVNHFFFIDNNSDDSLIEYLKGQSDCSAWHTEASYKASNFGVHWLNFLLNKYGVGHWCLTLDPDEFLVFPRCETRNLRELTEFMDSISQRSLFCVLVDMYSDRRVSETHYKSGQDPLDVARYFDNTGYVQRENSSYGEVYVRGGPRRRVFFRENPLKAPALNKTPLVKWDVDHNYMSSTHLLAPRRANVPHPFEHASVTGCLLHFKFISLLAEKAFEEIGRKEHFDNSIEYRQYNAIISDSSDVLIYEKSTFYNDSMQLCQLGFMSAGRWF